MAAPMRMMHMWGRDPDDVKGVKVGAGTRRRVLQFARPYRGMIAGFLLTIVVSSVLTVLPPLLFRTIIDDAVLGDDQGLLNVLAGAIVVIALGEAALSLLERWWSSRIGEGLIYDLRRTLFDHVQRMPIAFFTRTQTGALVSRLNNDVIGAQRALTGTLGSVVSNVITLAVTLVALLLLEWRLTLLALVLLPAFVLPAKRVGRILAAITREGMNLNASMNSTMTERFGVSGAQLAKLYGRPDEETQGFADRARRVRDIGVRSALYSRAFVVGLTLVGAIGTAAVYWIGGSLAIDGSITVGTLTAMAVLVARIYAPLTELTNARVDVMSAFVSFERVFEVLDAPNPITDAPDAVVLPPGRGEVVFEHVTFSYPSTDQYTVRSLELGAGGAVPADAGRVVLHDIDLRIAPGTMVAVVGPSGAGKSTLVSLVPRLYDVTGGGVRIDGHDVRTVTLDSLRSRIGVVSQDPHLFHETVLDNLRYARPGASLAEVEQACRIARIHDVIAALPEGYSTVVGERGYRMSGGEKQRLAIARMLLKDPGIVILDEATSHLDTENEALIQQALADALVGRTAIVIAHRLSTITKADQIVVLDGGRIVERGRHEELRAAGGLYADLYDTLVREATTA
jgi:ATP-binding cassette subfamily B protein